MVLPHWVNERSNIHYGIAACSLPACRKRPRPAAPPSSVMKSRRFTAHASRAFDRKDSTPRYGRRPLRCSDFDGLRTAQGVKMRRTRIEHMSSAYHPLAIGEWTSLIGRFVPGSGNCAVALGW